MKKALTVCGLLVLLLFLAPKRASANCYPTRAYGAAAFGVGGYLSQPCPGGSSRCTKDLCCDTVTECREQRGLGEGNATCNDGSGIDTAIGCIPFGSTNDFMGFVLKWAIGIGGGIAFILIIIAGFQIMTSTGNPERLKAGQQLLTSAIAGLILLVFSVFILRVIGVDILQIF